MAWARRSKGGVGVGFGTKVTSSGLTSSNGFSSRGSCRRSCAPSINSPRTNRCRQIDARIANPTFFRSVIKGSESRGAPAARQMSRVRERLFFWTPWTSWTRWTPEVPVVHLVHEVHGVHPSSESLPPDQPHGPLSENPNRLISGNLSAPAYIFFPRSCF